MNIVTIIYFFTCSDLGVMLTIKTACIWRGHGPFGASGFTYSRHMTSRVSTTHRNAHVMACVLYILLSELSLQDLPPSDDGTTMTLFPNHVYIIHDVHGCSRCALCICAHCDALMHYVAANVWGWRRAAAERLG